jgi:hypothetical protein
MTERNPSEVLDDEQPDPPPPGGPELDPAGAGDDELQQEPVHVDTMAPDDWEPPPGFEPADPPAPSEPDDPTPSQEEDD